MRDRQTTLTGAMAALLLLLVALLSWVEPPGDAPDGEPDFVPVFPDLDASDLHTLTLQTPSERVVLQRGPSGWRLSEPLDAAVDRARVAGVVDALTRAQRSAFFDGVEPGPYGLDEPAVEIIAMRAGASEPLRLALGDDSPAGPGTYLQDAAGRIAVSQTRLSATLVTSGDALRSRAVLSLARSAVSRVEVAGPAGAFSVQRDDAGWWIETDGARRRARSSGASALIGALADLRVEAFGVAPVRLEPAWSLRVSDGAAPQTVTIGAGPGPVRLVMGPALDRPATARTEALLDALDPEALLSAVLVEVSEPAITSLDLRLGAVSVGATRDGPGWAAASTVSVLERLPTIRADRSGEPIPPSGPPWGAVTVTDADGGSQRVEIFQQVGAYRVAAEPGGPPFRVLLSEVDRLVEAASQP